MERTSINIILEGIEIDSKYTFALKRQHVTKSELLSELLSTEQSKDKNVKYVRFKLNCTSAIFPALKSYLCAEDGPLEGLCINNWETDWLQSLDSEYVMDTLAVAGYMKIFSLCRLLYNYLKNEATNQSRSDFFDRFTRYENSTSLTDIEKERLRALV